MLQKNPNNTFARVPVFATLLFICILLLGCQLFSSSVTNDLTGLEVFEKFLNFDASIYNKDTLDEIIVEEQRTTTTFLTSIYMSYKASDDFLVDIETHDAFLSVHDLNRRIKKIKCTYSDIPTDFTYWTNKPITKNNKICYIGVFFPYQHIILYDATHGTVDHFIAGIRE